MTGLIGNSARLAIDGGVPVRETPLPAWPSFAQEEISTVENILKSGRVNYWTGEECRNFEKEFAEAHGVEHACALANGTLALELAFRVLGIGASDEVIVTPRSFFASASSIVSVGAQPVFADVDTDSQNITLESIQNAVTPNTRAILAVHLAGWPCDMPAIMEYARENKLVVVEDCAQASGARIGGRLVGSFWRCGSVFVLPGQDHVNGGRGWNATDQRQSALVRGVVVQRSWKKLG